MGSKLLQSIFAFQLAYFILASFIFAFTVLISQIHENDREFETAWIICRYLGCYFVISNCQWLSEMYIKKQKKKPKTLIFILPCPVSYWEKEYILYLVYFIFVMLKLECICYLIALWPDEVVCMVWSVFGQIAYGAIMVSFPSLSLFQLADAHLTFYKNQKAKKLIQYLFMIYFVPLIFIGFCIVLYWDYNLMVFALDRKTHKEAKFNQGQCFNIDSGVNWNAWLLWAIEDSGVTIIMVAYIIVHLYKICSNSHSMSNVNENGKLRIILIKFVAMLAIISAYNVVCFIETKSLDRASNGEGNPYIKSVEPILSLCSNAMCTLAMVIVIFWQEQTDYIEMEGVNVTTVENTSNDATIETFPYSHKDSNQQIPTQQTYLPFNISRNTEPVYSFRM